MLGELWSYFIALSPHDGEYSVTVISTFLFNFQIYRAVVTSEVLKIIVKRQARGIEILF